MDEQKNNSSFIKNALLLSLSAGLGIGAGLGIVHLYEKNQDPVSVQLPIGDSNFSELNKSRGLSEEELRRIVRKHSYSYDTISGNYLTGRFAQRNHDWHTAGENLSKILKKTGTENTVLMKRAMVLSMGAGDYETAFKLAQHLNELSEQAANNENSALATLFIAIKNFKEKKYDLAVENIRNMPEGSISAFVMPLLYSWSSAALGQYDVSELNRTSNHIYHAIMISDYLERHDQIEILLEKAMSAPNLSYIETQRIADIFAHIGNIDKALKLYEELQEIENSKEIKEKIAIIKKGDDAKLFEKIKSPEDGIAEALYDMARLLTHELNDESARVFANMTIYLNENHTNAKFLLANIVGRNNHEAEAIKAYQSITKQEGIEEHREAQQLAADLLEKEGQTEKAIQTLLELYKSYKDTESLIQIGDIYRRNQNFTKALEYYNRAEENLGGEIPAEYWHLHYVRGMIYEEINKWDKAETDLKAALKFEPNNPFVLNYIGYAWADQGKNLEQSLEFIERAVELRPMDGYITDSLGWVLYRMNRFKEAVPHLERAVELRPYDAVINDHLGDAYWRVGRKIEARFQWERAKNHADEDNQELKDTIKMKMVDGLPHITEPKTIQAVQNNMQ